MQRRMSLFFRYNKKNAVGTRPVFQLKHITMGALQRNRGQATYPLVIPVGIRRPHYPGSNQATPNMYDSNPNK